MTPDRPFSPEDLDRFVTTGWLRLDEAFAPDLAAACRDLLWREVGLSPDDPAGWTRPVICIPLMTPPPFLRVSASQCLSTAFDLLAGPGGWRTIGGVGSFVLRFPSPDDPGDAGWHVDASFGTEGSSDFWDWRINLASRGRALLVLLLFSDVGEDFAPTRLREGSHRDMACRLAPLGEAGMTVREQISTGFEESAHRPVRLATGPAGTAFLCHPFLVHAAQPHRGARARILAQPPLLPRSEAPDPASSVARAIQAALG